jgi:hypothetical protein
MASLAWIDFDEAERQRPQCIMALFQERESRDELGLGATCIGTHTGKLKPDEGKP